MELPRVQTRFQNPVLLVPRRRVPRSLVVRAVEVQALVELHRHTVHAVVGGRQLVDLDILLVL